MYGGIQEGGREKARNASGGINNPHMEQKNVSQKLLGSSLDMRWLRIVPSAMGARNCRHIQREAVRQPVGPTSD